MNITKVVLTQSKPRLWLGALRHTITRTQTYYSLMNVVLLLVTTYTVRQATIQQYLPWVNFWRLLGIGALVVVALAIIDRKLVYPSEVAYNQSQAWKHRSPVRKELEQMQQSISALQISLTSLQEAVDRLGGEQTE